MTRPVEPFFGGPISPSFLEPLWNSTCFGIFPVKPIDFRPFIGGPIYFTPFITIVGTQVKKKTTSVGSKTTPRCFHLRRGSNCSYLASPAGHWDSDHLEGFSQHTKPGATSKKHQIDGNSSRSWRDDLQFFDFARLMFGTSSLFIEKGPEKGDGFRWWISYEFSKTVFPIRKNHLEEKNPNKCKSICSYPVLEPYSSTNPEVCRLRKFLDIS